MSIAMKTDCKYPIGIQTFSEIIKGGYVYVDKTDLVWHVVHESSPSIRQVTALVNTAQLFFRPEGTVRGAENHGAGTRMGVLSRSAL